MQHTAFLLSLMTLVLSSCTHVDPVAPETSGIVTNCATKKELVKNFPSQEVKIDGRLFELMNLAHSIYQDPKTGFPCKFYYSSNAERRIYWQSQQNDDGSYTAWVIQNDGSYMKYDGAIVTVYDFNIERDENEGEVLVVLLHVLDAKDMNIVVDTASFTFEMEPDK